MEARSENVSHAPDPNIARTSPCYYQACLRLTTNKLECARRVRLLGRIDRTSAVKSEEQESRKGTSPSRCTRIRHLNAFSTSLSTLS